MLVKNQKITIAWHYKNKLHYESKGYCFTKFGDKFEVEAEDLLNTTHEKVLVQCDQCGKIFERDYRNYLKEHDEEFGDCCRKCNRLIAQRTCNELYGVSWGIQAQEFKDKQIQTCIEKYGVQYASQHELFRKTVFNTVQEKYGVDNVSQLPEVREKANKSLQAHGKCPTSKQQYQIFQMLQKSGYTCELNKPVGWYNLDCALEFNGEQIDIEYDGWYWHQDEEKDRRRDSYLINKGYKVLRLFTYRDAVPSLQQLEQYLNELITSNSSFLKIQLDMK